MGFVVRIGIWKWLRKLPPGMNKKEAQPITMVFGYIHFNIQDICVLFDLLCEFWEKLWVDSSRTLPRINHFTGSVKVYFCGCTFVLLNSGSVELRQSATALSFWALFCYSSWHASTVSAIQISASDIVQINILPEEGIALMWCFFFQTGVL